MNPIHTPHGYARGMAPIRRPIAHALLATLCLGATLPTACGESGPSAGQSSPSVAPPAPPSAETPPAETPSAAAAGAAPVSASVSAPPLRLSEAGEVHREHVLVVSVDGLRSDVLENEAILAELPALARLLRGPHTLDARTDPDLTVTLPNHVSMVTGRPVLGETGHAWTDNVDPPGMTEGGTVHARKGAYIASMFDVAHDEGVETAVVASKTKFWLLEQSYNWSTAAPDLAEPDHGRAKIDGFVFSEQTSGVARGVRSFLRSADGPSLAFVHFAAPDVAGHSYDWKVEPESKYMEAVEEVDAAIGTILDEIDRNPSLAGRTAIVLTADHGGGVPFRTHTDQTCPLNFRIPFLVWTGDGEAADLQELNPSRVRPAREALVEREAEVQPIRNGDAANVALGLLGLPPVPGSRYGADPADPA